MVFSGGELMALEIKSSAFEEGSPIPAEYTISIINGTTWKGEGKPVGDIQGNANASTFPLKLSGGGEMKKILG